MITSLRTSPIAGFNFYAAFRIPWCIIIISGVIITCFFFAEVPICAVIIEKSFLKGGIIKIFGY